MPELVAKPKSEWSVEIECRSCGYTYKYEARDVWVDSFKVSGYHFDGSAVCKDKAYVKCGNCEKLYFVSPPEHIVRNADRG